MREKVERIERGRKGGKVNGVKEGDGRERKSERCEMASRQETEMFKKRNKEKPRVMRENKYERSI